MVITSPFIFEVKLNTTGICVIQLDTVDHDGYRVILRSSWQSDIGRVAHYHVTVFATQHTPDITSAAEFRRFWICWSKGGSVGVGRSGDDEPFMSWTDPQPVTDITLAGYKTMYVLGVFRFNCTQDGFPGVCVDPPTQANTTGPVCNCPYLLGENCTYPCSPGYYVISGDVIVRTCTADGSWTDMGIFCQDIDECSTINGNCSQTCTNTVGSYNCSCSEGFVLDEDKHSCSST
ncbi:fibulin-5-like [Branchiostoma floridae]|uniref:Fibulin-5-like n=1 Tax=Branchiostoma floridae TaxID=7739 RepID=A0A9J7MUW5_BRAFL|nr:fibulin-5-like [Branchiostoma floridae]